MGSKVLREWKKVYLSDLGYIVYELKELAKSPCMILLDGPVGVGKTTFVQHFVGGDKVLSPTYSIVNEFPGGVHVDLYRIEKSEDILALELMPLLEGKQFFLVEWGEKYLRRLFKEIPEDFSVYQLNISVNEVMSTQTEQATRNFVLNSVTED